MQDHTPFNPNSTHCNVPSVKTSTLPQPSITIKPTQLLPRLLDLLPRLHPHIEDRTIPTTAQHLTMHTALTALTLCPQSRKPHLQLPRLLDRLRIQLTQARPTVLADGALRLRRADERLLAPHARLRLLGELHQPAQTRRRDRDAAGVVAGEQARGALLA